MNEQEILDSLVPNVYVSRITLDSTSDDKLLGNIQLLLKDKKRIDEISHWLDDNNVLKYLKIIVFQVIDESVTNKIIRIQNEIGTKLLNSRAFEDYLSSKIGSTGYSFKILSLRDLQQEFYTEKILDFDGYETINMYGNIEFGSDLNISENTEYLTYLIGSFYDLGDLLTDREIFQYNTDTSAYNSLLPFSLKVENVIANGSLISKSQVFLTPDGEIWAGEVHGRYRSGITETPQSVQLNLVEIENIKVQDYRRLKKILKHTNLDDTTLQSYDSDLEKLISEDLFSQVIPLSLTEQSSINLTNSSISDLFASIDRQGKVSLTFFIDFKRMFLENSIYGKTFSRINSSLSKNLINYYYNKATIESITIKSKRTDIDDSLFLHKLNEEEVAYLSGESLQVSKKNTLFDLDTDTLQLRTYSITDQTSKKEGIYQYSVEIEYLDNVAQQIQGSIKKLEDEKKLFEQYYEVASLPSAFNQLTNRFIGNTVSNFASSNNILPFFDGSGSNLIETILKLYYMDSSPETAASSIHDLSTIIENYLSPINGTPTSILYVIQLYNTVIDVLNRFISSTSQINTNSDKSGETTQQTKLKESPSRIVKINKTFRNKLDLINAYRLEYLDSSLRPTVDTVSNSSFSFEMLKADLVSKKIDATTNFTRAIDERSQKSEIFNKLYNILGNFTNLKINRFQPSDSSLQLNTNSTVDIPSTISPVSVLNDIILQQSLQNSDLDDNEKSLLEPMLLTLLNPTVNSSEQDINLIIDDSYQVNYFWKIQPSTAFITRNRRGISDGVQNLFLESNISFQTIRKMPNQIKSLVKLRTSSPTTVVGDGQIRIKYEMIKQIKKLKGFDYNNGLYMMSEPIWEILTDFGNLNNIRANINTNNRLQLSVSNSMIFCKLENYNNNSIKYRFNSALGEQITNQCFFINNDVHDNFLIKQGASRVKLAEFNSRITKETSRYFDDNSNVQIEIGGITINPDDSIENTKNRFLSPLGVYFDNTYRQFEQNSYSSQTVITPIQTVTPVETISTEQIDTATIQESYDLFDVIINRSRTIRDSSTSSTKRIINVPITDVTNYSRNDLVTNRNITIDSTRISDNQIAQQTTIREI